MTVEVKESNRIRIAIADPSNLVYSDDYRDGWVWGFRSIGCEVKTFDVTQLARIPRTSGMMSSKGWSYLAKELSRQISSWRPHLLWCHHGRYQSNKFFMDQMKRHRIKSAVYLCDEPYEVGETAKYSPVYDFVFTMDPCTIHVHHKARGTRKHVWYMPPAVNTDRFEFVPYSARSRRSNVSNALFLGNASLVPRPSYLKGVEASVDGVRILYWQTTGKSNKKWIPLKDHPSLYASCWLGLNVHRDPSIDHNCFMKRVKSRKGPVPQGIKLCSRAPDRWGTGFWNDMNCPAAHVNPRFFEMAAVGTCVISDDDRYELARMFPFAPRAKNPSEFLDLVNYYLENLDKAGAIGAKCSNQISRAHTYRHRAAEVLIRVGLMADTKDPLFSFLGEPKEWLTIQDFNGLGVNPLSEQTGLYEPFDRHTGLSQIAESGRQSPRDLLPSRVPWLS